MTIRFALVALAALSLAGCDDDTCTAEQLQAKVADLQKKIQEIGATDPARLQDMATKATALQTQIAGMQDDPQAACDAVDELMATLD